MNAKTIIAILLVTALLFLSACQKTESATGMVPKDVPPNSIQVCVGDNCQVIQLNNTDNSSADGTGCGDAENDTDESAGICRVS